MDLSKLNDKQKEAVKHIEGPLLILAGAGSGKTRVLTNRVAYLINEVGISPYNILAITFTNKAAKEMKERIFTLIGSVASSVQISTFHSFGYRIVRENAHLLGLDNNFTILDENDALTIIKKILKDMNLDPKQYSPKAIKNDISGAKNELMDPESYSRFANTPWDDIVIKVYKEYENTLKKNNAVDFDDLLMMPITLFKAHPDVLNNYQERYQYILIDEYQDTNEAQYKLSKMISAKYKNICVVGDNDQCLLGNTMIETKEGPKEIKNISKSDSVLTASGFGKTIYSKVTKINRRKYNGKVIRIKTKRGNELIGTLNHIVFSNLEVEQGKYYVYLMYKEGLGYRVGQTSSLRNNSDKVINGLMGRLAGEHGDKIWLIKVCNTRDEATYYEELISTKYGLPKIVFHNKGRGISLSQEKINEIFKNINTSERIIPLMNDYGLFLDYPHHFAQGTTNENKNRGYINICFFGGKYNKTRDMHTHRIGMSNSNNDDRIALSNLGFPIRNGRAKTWRLETERMTFENTITYVKMIDNLSSGYDIFKKIHLTEEENYHFMPLGSLREGMSIVINNNGKLEKDRISEIEFSNYNDYVYDINVANTHNYFANSIAVHNCIYSWRGANYNNILNFEKDYANAKVVLLEENYRSTKTILNAANNVIKNNRERKDKNLWTSNDEGSKIKYYRAFDEKDEAAYVVSHIKKLHDIGISYDEMAVLYRTNAQSRVLEEYFMMDNIPYKVVGAFSFYNRKEIKDLVAYLKLIYNERDDVNLFRCINVPKRGIGPKTLDNLQLKADSENKSIYEVIDSGKELSFRNLIEEFKEKAQNSSLTELVEYVINISGMKQELASEKSIEADIRIENLEEFKSITREFEERSGVISLEEFLMQISLVTNSEDVKDEIDKVSLMTMHAAKGLEFDAVFAVGIEEGIMPHSGFDTSESDIEEERRLFYVTITRAKKYLYIVNARMRMIFGDRNVKAESSFIKEIDEDNIEFENKAKQITPIIDKNDKFYADDVDYKPGDRVTHTEFGDGIVINVDKSIITVSFAYPYQVRKLLKNHKSIKKI